LLRERIQFSAIAMEKRRGVDATQTHGKKGHIEVRKSQSHKGNSKRSEGVDKPPVTQKLEGTGGSPDAASSPCSKCGDKRLTKTRTRRHPNRADSKENGGSMRE